MQFGSAGVATVRVVWDSFGTDKGPHPEHERMLCGPDSIIDSEEKG